MITAETLREITNYDAETGVFTWAKKTARSVVVGRVAGGKIHNGYVIIAFNKKSYLAHRLAWLYVHGDWPKGGIDHINGITSDNRISNLRDVLQSDNAQNRSKFKVGKSGLLGVVRVGNRGVYQSRIMVNRKLRYVGQFNTAEEANAAYLRARHKHHSVPIDLPVSD